MADERGGDPSVSQLLSGIIGDAQVLVRQEIALARQEISEEIDTAKQAGVKLGIAAGVLAMGGLLLVLTLAQGIADFFNWPSWAGYGLVGLVLAIAGYVLLSLAQKQIKAVHPVPAKTIETLKEHVEWIKDRTTSDKT